ncbi:MAG: right-handed parallel beta-helix repeat-containing protein, partial [Planctomycetes bacterium]|nr:right-handed parallel beta-helix repeat-containing protein [Planctomycetota bacterium]
TSTLTVDSVWYSTNVPEAGADRYYLQNKVELIDEEGEWAVEDLGTGSYRVYLWPQGSGNPADAMIEGSRRSRFVIEWGNMGYWVYDNLEIRHGAGHGIGCWSSANFGHITVQNCSIHHNDGTGIYGRYNENGLYRRNFVCFNDGGISVSDRGGVTIEECEVGDNWYDGIVLNGDDCTVRRSWIHGHWWWSHADNLQTWGDQSNLTIEDNLITNAGQSYMMAQCDHVYYTGNTIIGSRAYMVILGHDSCSDFWFDHNTMMFSHYGLINTSGGTNVNIANGLNVKGHHGSCWGATEAMGYASDYNLFWHADGMNDTVVIWEGGYGDTFAQYVANSGRDTHSVYASPQFTSVPHSYYSVSSMSGETFYSNRVYVSDTSDMGLINVGDHIELDFDGVVRAVTAKGADYVEFTPSDRRVAFKTGAMLNWKDKTDFSWDLTLQAGSPAIGLAQDGSNVGSSINVGQYMARDFDGDWVRDIPIWPYEPPPVCEVRKWEVLATHGAADIGHEFTDTTVYGGAPGVRRLRLVFGAPVDPATVNLSSVTIVGAASGDQSSTITGVTLADIDKAMTVELSGPLPDADHYTITLSEAVRAADGTEVQGVKSAVLAVLAGDVNNSGSVGPADFMEVRNRAGRDLTETTAAYDVDGNGVITTADLRTVRAYSGNVLP